MRASCGCLQSGLAKQLADDRLQSGTRLKITLSGLGFHRFASPHSRLRSTAKPRAGCEDGNVTPKSQDVCSLFAPSQADQLDDQRLAGKDVSVSHMISPADLTPRNSCKGSFQDLEHQTVSLNRN